jgi:preprotein translocase subunit SecE
MADNKEITTSAPELTTTSASAPATVMGLTKYVHFVYFAGTVVVAWLFVKITEQIWTSLNLAITAVPPPSNLIEIVVGGGIAVVLGVYLWRQETVKSLVMEIVVELSKVTWPSRKELSASTVVVIILSAVAAIIIGLFDFFWSWVTDIIYHTR